MRMLAELFIVFLVAIAVGVIVTTVTKASIFKPLREFLKRKNKWLGKLFSCSYCFSHWVSAIAALFLLPEITGRGFFFDWGLSTLIIIFIGSMISDFISFVHHFEEGIPDPNPVITELLDSNTTLRSLVESLSEENKKLRKKK